MPDFTYSPENYTSVNNGNGGSWTVSQFQSYLSASGNRLSGTFYVEEPSPVSQDTRIDLTNVVISGDTNLITNTPIFTNGTTDQVTDAMVFLASTYQPPTGTTCDVNQDGSDCAMHLKNNFATSGATAVLIYAPYGPVAVKNNALQHGAIYADSLEIKNNQTLTYDVRVERVAGFGPVTLEVVKWLELNA